MPSLHHLPRLMGGIGGSVNGVGLVHGSPWGFYTYIVWLEDESLTWKIRCCNNEGDEVWCHLNT